MQARRLLGKDRIPIVELVERFPFEQHRGKPWRPGYAAVYIALETARNRGMVDRDKRQGESKLHYWACDPPPPPPPPPPSSEEILANLRSASANLPTEVRRKLREKIRAEEEAGRRAQIRRVGEYMGIPLFADGFPPVEVHNMEAARRFAVRGRACPQCGQKRGHAEGCMGAHPAYLEEGEDLVYVRGDLHDTAQQAGVDCCEIWERESADIAGVVMMPRSVEDDVPEYRETREAALGVPYWRVEFN
jgi:hypothetical protein